MAKLKLMKLPQDMGALAIDMKHPNRTLIHGCFEEHINVNDQERHFYTYIPDGLEYCQPCIVVAPPSCCDALEYLETSGLRALADIYRLYIHILIPDGAWRTDGKDADFMNAVYAAIQRRDYYVTMQDNIYACGLGNGAIVAHQAAQRMTSEWSGLFSVGTLNANLQATRDVKVKIQPQNGAELLLSGARCQLPVWIAVDTWDDNMQAAVEYWKEQNHSDKSAFSGEGADKIWFPSGVKKYAEINEEQIAQLRVTYNGTVDFNSLSCMWRYIGRARRHRGYGHKNLRYFKSPEVYGATRHEITFNGMSRLWYEYVPEQCTPDRHWPLVVVMHGRGGTAETFFDLSSMSQVAEERGFITVFPQAGIHQQKHGGLKNVLFWNGSYNGIPVNDVGFIRAMVADVVSRLPVDRGRIYACGQSSGGIMADVLSVSASDLFTACASWSGMYHPMKVHRNYPRTASIIPTMFICGKQDAFCTEAGMDSEFPFRLIPELRRDIVEKIKRCNLDVDKMQTWETYPITWYCYPDAQQVPMLTVGIVEEMAHASFPEESWISYDQFFSNFARGTDGLLRYRGHVVESCQKKQ
ncbi:MAG: PHB depolymerase family esterase [Pyramidobacter sp.]